MLTQHHYTYVIKHGSVPIWVGVGTGIRYEVGSHCTPTATPEAKRDYILAHREEITSKIVLADVSIEEAWEKETALILEYGLRCEGGTLFNRTYGGGMGDVTAPAAQAETTARRRANRKQILLIAERIARERSVTVTTALHRMRERLGIDTSGWKEIALNTKIITAETTARRRASKRSAATTAAAE